MYHMESRNRSFRRLLGALKARLPELGLAQVEDPRGEYNRGWRLYSLLTSAVAGCAAGCKGLGEVESLTEVLAHPLRGLLGISRRVPDTTLRDTLVKVKPEALRPCLHRQVYQAHRRKALCPSELPCGVVSIDGKYTKTPKWDEHYAQRQSGQNGQQPYGLVRTLTCSLITAAAVPCLDAVPIPVATNEMGHFKVAVSELEKAYGGLDLYEVIMGDAGMCSLDNATYIHAECNKGYIFRIKETQPTLLTEARRLLAGLAQNTALATHAEVLPGNRTVTRRLWLTTEMEGWLDWTHLRTVFRLQVTTVEKDGSRTQENRYYVSNVRKGRFKPHQWITVFRSHWHVENNCHWTGAPSLST